MDLTAREYRMIETLMRRPGWIVSRDALIESVWGYDFTDTSNLVEAYIGRIRRKLGEIGAPPLIQTVRGAGYRLRASRAHGDVTGGSFARRTRLTLWYVALLAGTLIVLGGLGYWTIRQRLYASQDDVLRSKAAAVATEVDLEKGRLEFPDDGPRNALPSVAAGLDVVRVWDQGRHGGLPPDADSELP